MDNFKFRTDLGEITFRNKYAVDQNDTWSMLCRRVVEDVCGTRWGTQHALMSKGDRDQLTQYMIEMKFIPAGRYLRFAGKDYHQFSNCFALIGQEDTREEWARVQHDVSMLAMTEGGVGVDLSVFRPQGYKLKRTGGVAGGPVALGASLNEIIRYARQGNDRRGALWLGLNWQHEDIEMFMRAKEYTNLQRDLKAADFNHPLPFDMTNMSIQWDDYFFDEFGYEHKFGEVKKTSEGIITKGGGGPLELTGHVPELFYQSVEQMCRTGEPGHSYNFGGNALNIGRNACTEFTTDLDSDSCNLGSVNMSRVTTKEEMESVVCLGAKFLVCGSIRGDLPNDKCRSSREESRKIGLGIMGVHEWLLQRGHKYAMCDELAEWMEVYRNESERAAIEHSERFFISPPTKFRAIAPTGTIGIIAGTTTGIEPLFGTAYKRRYLGTGDKWQYQYNIEPIALELTNDGLPEEEIETSLSLAEDVERRIKFQYDIQRYVDMGVSSTINLPAFGTDHNNPSTARNIASCLLRYCGGLRGITVYPDGASGLQPLTQVSIEEAKKHCGSIYAEDQCISGVCGV